MKLERPIKIVASSDDRVYVLEPHRVLEYDYFGTLVRTIGSGLLRNARGFDVSRDYLIVVTTDSLFWFSKTGALVSLTLAHSVIASSRLIPLEDVAIHRDRLYLLSPSRVFVFQVRQ